MKDAACRAIYGRRGSGKTTLAGNLIGGHKRVIVFDAMGEYAARPDFTACDSIGDVLATLMMLIPGVKKRHERAGVNEHHSPELFFVRSSRNFSPVRSDKFGGPSATHPMRSEMLS